MTGQNLFAPPEDQNAFTDILFNALLGFAFMFSVAFILIRPEVTEGKINPKAEFMITAQWPDGHQDDIDLIVEDGEGNLVWFDAREAGLMHLDRDDRGWMGDAITVSGKRLRTRLIKKPSPFAALRRVNMWSICCTIKPRRVAPCR